jgi:hypothetical protein
MLKILKKRTVKIILVIAIVLAMGIGVFGWHKFYALAQSLIDSFTDTSRVAKTWNVTVTPGTGVQLATRSCDSGTWFCSQNTVCPDLLGDGSYIIVKQINETYSVAWKTTNTSCAAPQCATNTGQNENDLVADNTVDFSTYSARLACAATGGRLPTLAELQCIYNNRTTFGNNFGSRTIGPAPSTPQRTRAASVSVMAPRTTAIRRARAPCVVFEGGR